MPPPGRFWVNGYWKRDQDGWYRVPGFWSDRKTDRLDYRKDGPPKDRPDDSPGEPPAPDCFYIPGQYYPDKDGVVWRKGFWAKVQPGWAGFRPTGIVSPKDGPSRKATGTGPSKIAGPSSLRPKLTSPLRMPVT